MSTRDEIAERLRSFQAAWPVTPKDLRKIGIEANDWSHWTAPTQHRTITVTAARKLKAAFGITLDWIYEGDVSTLHPAVLDRLQGRAA